MGRSGRSQPFILTWLAATRKWSTPNVQRVAFPGRRTWNDDDVGHVDLDDGEDRYARGRLGQDDARSPHRPRQERRPFIHRVLSREDATATAGGAGQSRDKRQIEGTGV